jgi:alkanesulfonate monooxygenase SsuD/methylene tetrahydromethanopterin reductase-like flavin-dependent oxidoreductase (luciferase family)
MTAVILHYDLRSPESGVPAADMYQAALDQCAWADELGLHAVTLSCHHGVADNYCPSQLTFAAAAAARTEQIAFNVLVTIPLYNPIQLAEEFAVLDIISRGRAIMVGVLGYRNSEYVMFGVDRSRRAQLMEEGLEAVKKAWTGDTFDFQGRRVMVRPRPVSRPRPTVVLGGDSRGAARRAARLADGFMSMPTFTPGVSSGRGELSLPIKDDGALSQYVEACAEVGVSPRSPLGQRIPCMYLQVAKDPDAMARRVEPYLLHVANSYAEWMEEAGVSTSYSRATDVDQLRATGNFQIVTPTQCVEIAKRCDGIMFDPLFGGIPPEIAWESLELFRTDVLPEIALDTVPGTALRSSN